MSPAAKKKSATLAKAPSAVFFVSQRDLRRWLSYLASDELEGRGVREFQGGYAEYLLQKAELLAQAERVEQNRLNLLRRG